MATVYIYKKLPVMVEGYEKFKGPNPWAPGTETLWYVGGFRWGVNQKHDFSPPKTPRTGGKQPPGIWAGAYSPESRILRLLPKELQDLWWTQKLAARDFPWFLHELSPDTADMKPGTYINEIVFGGIILFFWLMCTGVVVKTMVVEGTLRNLLSEFAGWACLAMAILPPLVLAWLLWSSRTKSQRLREQGQAILLKRSNP